MSALLFLALPASRNEKTLDRLCSGSITDDDTREPSISLSLYDAHASFTDIVSYCSGSPLSSPTRGR